MSVATLPVSPELARIEALLDRLDPQPAICAVPGCLHLHEAGAAHAHGLPAAA